MYIRSVNPGRDKSPFPKTRWTLIKRISDGDPDQRKLALEEACTAYWPPIYAFICALGYSPHDAEDLTQGFFARFLSKDRFAAMDPEKGRLRSYLLKSVKHFLADEQRRADALKRGGRRVLTISPEEIESLAPMIEEAAAKGPDHVYDRLWARRLLEGAYRRVEQHYHERGQSGLFDRLAPFIRSDQPIFESKDAEELGLSPGALRIAAFRLRQRYGAALRESVAETLEPGADVTAELRYLRTLFS